MRSAKAWAFRCTISSAGGSAQRIPCYATTGYFTDDPDRPSSKRQLGRVDTKHVRRRQDQDRRRARNPTSSACASPARSFGDDILLMVDINGNYTVDIALESDARRSHPTTSTGARSRCRRTTSPAMPSSARGRRSRPVGRRGAFRACMEFERLIDARGARHPSAAAFRRRRLRRACGGRACSPR